ncbi:MAG TPA: DUF4342 domain-containing protein [Leptolyngbyaceae cyanobacterium]
MRFVRCSYHLSLAELNHQGLGRETMLPLKQKMNAQVERIEDQVTTVVVDSTPVESETNEKERVEEFNINHDSVLGFFKKVIHQGKLRQVAVKGKQGNTLVKVPLIPAAVGLTGATLLFPFATVVAAVAVFGAKLTLVIERQEEAV